MSVKYSCHNGLFYRFNLLATSCIIQSRLQKRSISVVWALTRTTKSIFSLNEKRLFFSYNRGEPLNGFFYIYVRTVIMMVIFRDQYDRDPIVARHEKNMHIRNTIFKQDIAYPYFNYINLRTRNVCRNDYVILEKVKEQKNKFNWKKNLSHRCE